ncbi:type II secretion system F family protein [Actinomadura madurae]|uniref:type II secretion system F family protein n=2 Tax=Actinomadura madurae TaxID=1993 RepID=UPI0020264C33|nr:type II secretion system F family protein [Actinomadura madurae]MCP9952365.1 type II secretion system F family protein [Actinomadura madurae]MCP9969133.1 type II secretion system F family protein [Actinomadura madurae]MCP9981605.1 type II secretion system F family protein [Actinomadura madurae]MCQ0006890.1 type II secretion system F family protein [Actinomadura madurae]MCQ0017805.1 type II secretion system F family protein [Actinomadura madurae]
MIEVLAVLCAAAAAWTLLTPSPASHRLDRLTSPKPSNPLRPLRTRIETFREHRTRPQRRRTAVIELCDAMAAELAAGRTPDEAFTAAATVLDPHVSAELLSLPRPPPDHLDKLAAQPGAEGLRLLAACWRVGSERGGTLATVLDGLASALRDEETQRQEVSVQLAGPRATARLLAALPLLGLAMAAALGAHPIPFLFGTLPGLACLTTGTTLNATGLYWTRHLSKSAESPH